MMESSAILRRFCMGKSRGGAAVAPQSFSDARKVWSSSSLAAAGHMVYDSVHGREVRFARRTLVARFYCRALRP
jgi:hypothetical protein